MNIDQQLSARLKDAMRAKDRPVLDAIRNARTEIQKAATAEGASGEITDELCRDVIAAYVKKLQKALPAYDEAGDRGADAAAKLRFEIDYLSEWLPSKLDEDATRALVEAAVASSGATEPKDAGRVMGTIMKAHKDEVDTALVKRLVDAALAP
ncbi:MAG: GatB/YqeY domain-containing protein [Acidimicrobiia bacterium]|nr:GatB/YqeY domain-containing protein [Acidimicrobiia bacterium]